MLQVDPIPRAKRTRFTPAAGIASTNVQAAIEELAGDVIALGSPIIDFKDSVRVATTANITLSGAQTIDGVSVIAGNRVLVKNQSTGSQNGIYVCASGSWARATDADGSSEVTAGMVVASTEGAANADKFWELTTNDPIVVGTTALAFAIFSGAVTSVFGRTGAVTATSGDYTASQITFTPSGTIEATNVGAAIAELDSEMPERIDDRVAGLLVEGANITLTYDDALNTLTIDADVGECLTLEDVDDRVAALLVEGDGITLVYDDVANTLTITAAAGDLATTLIPGYNIEIDHDTLAGTFEIDNLWTTEVVTDGPTIVFDLDPELGGDKVVTIAGNRDVDVVNEKLGKEFKAQFIQGGTGNYSVNFLFEVEWLEGFQPVQTPVVGKSDEWHFLCVRESGPYVLAKFKAWVETTERPQPHQGFTSPDQDTNAVVTLIQNGSAGLEVGLTNYFKLDEASGSRADSIGTDDLGEVGGTISAATGKISDAAALGHTSKYLTVDAAFSVSGSAYSMSCWFYFSSGVVTEHNVSLMKIVAASPTSLNYRIVFDRRAQKISFKKSGTTLITTSGLIGMSAWHHVVATISPSGDVVLYVDNVVQGTASAGTPTATLGHLQIGYPDSFDSTTASSWYRVDEAGLWNRELSADEVTVLDNSGAGQTTPLTGSVNEIQQIAMVGADTPTFGTFDLTLDGDTATLDYDEDASGATTKLEAAFGNGVTVGGGPLPATALSVEFTDDLGDQNLDLMVVDNAGMHTNAAFIDWSVCDNFLLTLNPGSGSYITGHVNVIDGKTIHVAVTSNGASGTISWDAGDAVVDWGIAGPPACPADGHTLHVEFYAESITDIKGKVWFDRPCPVVLFDRFADVGTTSTGGTEDDLYSNTIPAGRLSTNGDKITETEYATFVASSTAARRLKKYFAGTLIWDSGAVTLTLGGDFTLSTLIMRESASVVRCLVTVTSTSASTVPYVTETRITGLTLANTQTLKTTGIASGTGAAAGDIVEKLATIEFKPAAT